MLTILPRMPLNRSKVTMRLSARVKESEAQMVFSLILPSRVKGSDQDRFILQMKAGLHRWFTRRALVSLTRKMLHKPLVKGGFYVMKRVYTSLHDIH